MAVVFLYPDAIAADSSAWTLTGAPTKPEAIDDPEGQPDDDTSYLACTTTIAGVEQIAFNFGSMPEAVSITSVKVWIRSKLTIGVGNHQVFINGGGGAGHTLDAAYTDYSDTFTIDPLTGLDWSRNGVNTCAVTIVQDATAMVARLTQMYLEVTFVASAALIGAARDVGSRIVRANRRPLTLPQLEGPLLWGDCELYTDFAFSHYAYPNAQGAGAGMESWRRALLRVLGSDINLDSLTVTLSPFDLRHYLVRFWDTGISEEPPGATAPGAARLDPGVLRTYTRASKAWAQNAAVAAQGGLQIKEIGVDVEHAETLGMLIEEERTNDLIRSAFDAGVSTGWTVTGNVVVDTADLLFESTVTVNSARFARSGVANCRLSQAPAAYAGSETLCLSVWHKDDSATALTWTLQRSTDSFFWNDSTAAWGAAATQNAFTVRSSTARDHSKPIVLSAAAQTLTLTFYAEGTSGQINHLYHAQLEEGLFPTSQIVTGSAVVTREPDVLQIANGGPVVWWQSQGTARCTFIPQYGASNDGVDDPILFNISGEATAYEHVRWDVSDGNFVYARYDGSTLFEAFKSHTLVEGESVDVVVRWTGEEGELDLAPFAMSIFVNGVKGTDVVADSGGVGGASLDIGSFQGTGQWANGWMSHITITPFVLSDGEIPDWL